MIKSISAMKNNPDRVVFSKSLRLEGIFRAKSDGQRRFSPQESYRIRAKRFLFSALPAAFARALAL
ncbi:MAG: hypothetical protein P8P70_08715 [Sulfitobacter sp.]|nr:hypothetical protein [Sulfitobacter sp.]